MPELPVVPPPARPGDRVAVLSPSWAGPAVFPERHALATRRLRELFGIEPVDFAFTTRQGSARERAEDLMAAFADDSIAAIIASIGGDDQMTVLPHLDPEVVRAHPKRFLGYSDNTNLLNWLWFHGVAGFYGGSTIANLARYTVHPVHEKSLRAALFGSDALAVTEVAEFSEEEVDWHDPDALAAPPPMQPGGSWTWHVPAGAGPVRAATWGGCVDLLDWVLASNRFVHDADRYRGCVLLLESSEELPSAESVFRTLRNLGERGLLEQFAAVVVGRPKAATVGRSPAPEERIAFRSEQRAAVLRALGDYNPTAPAVFDVDFGHTEPQWVLPYGGVLELDPQAGTLVAHY